MDGCIFIIFTIYRKNSCQVQEDIFSNNKDWTRNLTLSKDFFFFLSWATATAENYNGKRQQTQMYATTCQHSIFHNVHSRLRRRKWLWTVAEMCLKWISLDESRGVSVLGLCKIRTLRGTRAVQGMWSSRSWAQDSVSLRKKLHWNVVIQTDKLEFIIIRLWFHWILKALVKPIRFSNA